jgi:hypothetical protein
VAAAFSMISTGFGRITRIVPPDSLESAWTLWGSA